MGVLSNIIQSVIDEVTDLKDIIEDTIIDPANGGK
jgi:hypothetical protein